MQTVTQQKFEKQSQFSSRRPTRPRVGSRVSSINASWHTQYRLPTDGRKWRVNAKRRQAVAKYVNGFPNGFYQSLDTIARKLNETEVGNFRWCRRTVAYTLRDLRRLGVVGRAGYKFKRGGRIRTLHPECLGPRILHSEPVESCTQENITSQNTTTRQTDSPTRPKVAECGPAFQNSSKSTAKPERKPPELTALEILDYITHGDLDIAGTGYSFLGHDPQTASSLMHYLAERIEKRKVAPPIRYRKAYYLKAIRNFFGQYEDHVANGILSRYGLEEAGYQVHYCEEHQKWETANYPCEHCRKAA
jgi:hypothetical protein